MSVYDLFVHRKPACFGTFVLAGASDIDTDWGPPPEFLSKYVRCHCGERHLNIYACPGDDMQLAPVILECPRCRAKAEIFHPEKHGYDGQFDQSASMVGAGPPELFNPSPSEIIVEYSYQGEENYEELLKEGIMNLEDYFDVFAIYVIDEGGELREVTSYECA